MHSIATQAGNPEAVIITSLRHGNGCERTKAVRFYDTAQATRAYVNAFFLARQDHDCPNSLAELLAWDAERTASSVETVTLADFLDYANDQHFGLEYWADRPAVMREAVALGWIEEIESDDE